MRYSHVLGAAVVGLAAASAVQAQSISVSLAGVNNVAGSLPSDVRTFDLMVTTTGGAKWSSADIKFDLINSGFFAGTTFYNTSASNIETFGGAGSIAFDTAVSSPLQSTAGTGSIAILGKAEIGGVIGPSPTTPVFPTATETSVDVAWGDYNNAAVADGTYRIARFSVQGPGGAFIDGRVGVANNVVAPVSITDLYLPILGDTNGDFAVDATDFANILNNLGTPGPLGDTNYDGTVDAVDFTNVLNRLGTSVSPGASLGAVVPEPASLGLIGLVGLAAMRRRK